jgi:hypothetical protein
MVRMTPEKFLDALAVDAKLFRQNQQADAFVVDKHQLLKLTLD